MSLSDTRIRAAKSLEKIYKMYDADGLYIEVPPKGSKRWRFKYRFGDKEKRISLGLYPEVSLKGARERRDAARQILAEGTDPSLTFRSGLPRDQVSDVEEERVSSRSVAQEWFAMHEKVWKASHSRTIELRLVKHLYPVLGSRHITEILPAEVLALLRGIERNNTVETAKRVYSICSQIFRFAVSSALILSDPCRDLKGALAPVQVRHYPTLTTPDAIGCLLRSIDGYTGSCVVRAGLQLLASDREKCGVPDGKSLTCQRVNG